MSQQASLEDRVRGLVVKMFLGGDASFPLEADTPLISSGICDSLGLVKLAAELERELPGLRIDDQEITHENMGSVAAIAAFIKGAGIDG